ncbi:MAG: sigma-54-dependent Fis family transcriptional regulator [Bacteroidetes Order II. Incertae sedis bacterium]|jgi:two-component system, NtrC family, nitrogen regulation response regulator NtrX|nr:sigma-54-dependent Fis family transcriptional regulator [Bacteroidetes Order II. bacterium]MBT4052225.1 sigma-54-dependent Fis family transcriptional regulator [Bacteroidetes Order II. bacterium]MBT4603659.1 sigma-54-dependent Fis family transcriptional regulator [Bacteroidetes Order II. bacterium]MBT5249785.1 sigma-54-dependent Fis family transcriptional regulator [Bacteroidetes Order II. bacterium]MBT6201705.1 sigma-54-dependent Fis family transcriptional regulator [Bacteroidetes Order II.
MAVPVILVVDDEASIRRTLKEILEYEDFAVDEAEDGEEALKKLRSDRFDVVLLDVKMPKKDGMEVLEIMAREQIDVPVVMISGHGTIETAVEATRLGAFDFVEKPPDLNRLLLSIRNALDRGQLESENRRMRQTIVERHAGSLTPMLGESSAIKSIKDTIDRVAPTEARVLITGEAGTGKELVAKWVHRLSGRSEGPIVEVNCAAIPSELIESELFGHEKGSFTGATKQRIGKFEQAHGGTLFLDEIGDMSLSAQAKVLRALQENTITRVGGDRSLPVDVRVIAATNKNLLNQIEEREFREDLYHRLSVILIHVPPLRERRSDVPLITEHIAERIARRNGLEPKPFSKDALSSLQNFDWRGNVRELHNVVERLTILSQGERITQLDVERYVIPGGASSNPVIGLLDRFEQFSDFRDSAEKLFIEHKLMQYDWNISRTAEAIGIQRSHLYNKMSKYEISRDDE